MTMPESKKDESDLRLWVRAVVTGLSVVLAGLVLVVGAVWANQVLGFEMPWSAPVVLGFLGLLVWYATGRGWPQRHQAAWRTGARLRMLSPLEWFWSSCFLVFALLARYSISAASRAFLHAEASVATVAEMEGVLLILTFKVLAPAVVEEIGFRGFMQAPLERRYGYALPIAFVSVVFGLLHGREVFADAVLTGAIFGLVASGARSTWPAIAGHALNNGLSYISRLEWVLPVNLGIMSAIVAAGIYVVLLRSSRSHGAARVDTTGPREEVPHE